MRMSTISSIFGRRCAFKYRRFKVDQRLSTIELDWIMGMSSCTARAQIGHRFGEYQFFHRYSHAQDCPDLLQASCISITCALQFSFLSKLGRTAAENTGKWTKGCQCKWHKKSSMSSFRRCFSGTHICLFLPLPASIIAFSTSSGDDSGGRREIT